MKTLLLIILFSTLNVFGASKGHETQDHGSDKLKWLKLGYEVAREHAPDYDMIQAKVGETCEEAEVWEPNRALGESARFAPKGYEVAYYYESFGLVPIYYRCLKPVTKEG